MTGRYSLCQEPDRNCVGALFADGRRTAVSIYGHTFWSFPSRLLLVPYIEIPIHTVRKKKYGQLQDIWKTTVRPGGLPWLEKGRERRE